MNNYTDPASTSVPQQSNRRALTLRQYHHSNNSPTTSCPHRPHGRMTKNMLNPSTAFSTIFSSTPSTVGSQRLSPQARRSHRARRPTSPAAKCPSLYVQPTLVESSALTWGCSYCIPKCFIIPGSTRHGCEKRSTTPGKIFLSFSAAHAALNFLPLKQSSKSNSSCWTRSKNRTCAESMNVIVYWSSAQNSMRNLGGIP